MKISAVAGQPGYALRISVSGRQGLVEVRNDAGSLAQTLICPLLRDVTNPSDAEIKSVAEEFVSHFETEDLDFDGYLDLKGVREFGAKWGRYCVWLFNPQTHTFERSRPLAEQMELLSNLTADPKRGLIISYSIGPVNPSVDEYRIERISKDRPYWPRLIPVRSCFIEVGPKGLESDSPDAIVVQTLYDHGTAVMRRPRRSGLCSEEFGNRW